MDYNEIQRTLEIFKPGKLIEIRSCGSRPTSGYFKDIGNLIASIRKNPGETYYFVMNDISDDCYSREQNEKLLIKPKAATSDGDIAWREWLLIDADPRRVSGVSATDDEKAKAKIMLRKVFVYLRNLGFTTPVIADSGNGYHLLYRIEMKNTAENTEIVKSFLQAIAMLFSDECVDIDTSVFNASRITKLYGTDARKGTNTPDRPHRQSRLLSVPEQITPTSIELLKKVSALLPKPVKPSPGAVQFDIDDFITRHGIRVQKTAEWSGGIKYVLDECLFDSNHKSPDAAIIVLNNGALVYHCFHSSCQHYHWQDVRLRFEPDAYDPKEQPSRITNPQPALLRKPVQSSAPPTNAEKFLRLQDIARYDRSQIVSIPSGFHALDKRIIGFNKGEFSVWSGGNGSGKSTILSQLALESINSGFNVAMFSGEMTSHRMKNWIHLQAAGRTFNKPSQYDNVFYTPHDIGDKIDTWTGERLWIYNNDYGMDANAVMTDIKTHIQKHHTDVVIIDNLMSLDMSKIPGEKYDRQSSLVLSLSDMAKQHNIHIHFVCHPRKPNGFLRKADISGTADLTNAADNVVMMHRVNNDFKKLAKDFFPKGMAEKYFDFTNVIEVMKNRDLGIEDELIGLYFERESKRMLNSPFENKAYAWDDTPLYEVSISDEDNPFLGA